MLRRMLKEAVSRGERQPLCADVVQKFAEAKS